MSTLPVRDDGIKNVTFLWNAALAQYRLVKLSTADETVEYQTNADDVIGVTQRATEVANESVAVKPLWFTMLTLWGTVAKGNYLTAWTDGKAVVATTWQRVSAVAIQAWVADDVVEVKLVTPFTAA